MNIKVVIASSIVGCAMLASVGTASASQYPDFPSFSVLAPNVPRCDPYANPTVSIPKPIVKAPDAPATVPVIPASVEQSHDWPKPAPNPLFEQMPALAWNGLNSLLRS